MLYTTIAKMAHFMNTLAEPHLSNRLFHPSCSFYLSILKCSWIPLARSETLENFFRISFAAAEAGACLLEEAELAGCLTNSSSISPDLTLDSPGRGRAF